MDKSESPQSVTTQMYYKGFSLLVTKRSVEVPTVDIENLIDQQIEIIDWAMGKYDVKPSWNQDTNKTALDKDSGTAWVQQAPVNRPGDLGVCKDCGAPNKLSKAGKPYCSKLCWK